MAGGANHDFLYSYCHCYLENFKLRRKKNKNRRYRSIALIRIILTGLKILMFVGGYEKRVR